MPVGETTVRRSSEITPIMRLLMTALGSYGDVLPIVGLASAMIARGHQATIIANPHFQTVVESAGVSYLPLGTRQEYDDLAHHPPDCLLQSCSSPRG